MNLKMLLQAACAALLVTSILSCQKDTPNYVNDTTAAVTDSNAKKVTAADGYTTYTIRAGEQYCEHNSYPHFAAQALYFTVKFDSSAIYQNRDPHNQGDENKLYGFSDNNSLHHQFSARFGWRWYNGELQLAAYTYNKGVCTNKVIGTIAIGVENKCAIIVNGDHYDFVINGVITSVPRASKTSQAVGYKLLPYFGGDEAAPHTITIKIREEKGL